MTNACHQINYITYIYTYTHTRTADLISNFNFYLSFVCQQLFLVYIYLTFLSSTSTRTHVYNFIHTLMSFSFPKSH